MRRVARSCAVAFALVVSPVFDVHAGATPPPKGVCQQDPSPGVTIRPIPWAQRLFDFQRAWTFTKGKGVTVAVMDSGVDTEQPQLARSGKVLPGFDFLRRKPGAHFDCIGHGTAVAGIIAATPVADHTIGFTGVAPDARILPVRITDSEDPTGQATQQPAVGPVMFAKAIRYAVDQGVSVMNLSVTVMRDTPEVRAAIAYAERKDVVVIAAVGNLHAKDISGATTTAPDLPLYPAAYPGVLGVGAITQNGSIANDSEQGSFVDLVAPGEQITAPVSLSGYGVVSGTSFAAPYVAGTAALVRAEYPQLNARQVISRLIATADPAPGNPPDRAYGYGVVDPVRAVTESFDDANPVARQVQPTLPKPDFARAKRIAAARQRASNADNSVLVLSLAGAGVALLLVIFSRGRRRGWASGRVELPD